MLRAKSGVWAAVIALAILLLGVLAALQYRWIGQVSEAEREHMQVSLRSATMRFSRDFRAEITRAMRRAGTTAVNRELIRQVYLVRPHEGEFALFAMDRETGRLQPAEWPERLAQFRRPRQVSSLVDNGTVIVEEPRMRHREPNAPAPPQSPGRATPDPSRLSAPGPPAAGPPAAGPPAAGPPAMDGMLLAELDVAYIRTHVLPSLVANEFSTVGEHEYQLLIVNRADPSQVVYSSEPGLREQDFRPPDAEMGLFDSHMPMPHGGEPESFPDRGPGPGAPPDSHSPWRLLVRHRSGSLEAAVDQTRRRNLAVSFLVLLLMGGGITTIAVWTHRAQRLAALQMEFVAGVSHELRTPLAVICSAGDNLAAGIVANEQQVRRYGTMIRNEGRKLATMVDEVLGFAGSQVGGMRPEFQQVMVVDIIDRAIASCDSELKEKGCQVEKLIDPNLPPLLADPTQLTQCVRNLVSNAAKYGNGDKWIGIAAETARAPRAEIRIRVTNHGNPIDPADLPHVFEPFYRGRKAIADQVRGAGLGLSLVKRIMDAHAGAVEVVSRSGEGTSFTLRIPLTG